MSSDGSRPGLSVPLGIILPIILALLLSILAMFIIAIPTMQENLIERKRETAKELVETIWSRLNHLERRVQSSELSREQAQELAIEEVRAIRYGPQRKDYFWINDTQPKMVMHPYRPELEGQDLSTFRDRQGDRPFVEFVEVVRDGGQGFVDYYWQRKDDPNRIEPKTSFVKLFEPWGWIVGTGIYMDDVRAEVSRLSDRLALTCLVLLLVAGLLSAYAVASAIRTEREKRATADELASSEAKYRTLFEASGDAVLLTKGDLVIDCNQAAVDTFRFKDRNEFIGLGPIDVSPPKQPNGEWSRDCARGLIAETFEKGSHRFEWVHRRSDGSDFPTEITLTVMTLDGERVMQAIVRDITEAKRIEEALASERERLFSLLETLPAFVYLQAEDHTIHFANHAFVERFGKPDGRRCYEALQGIDRPCDDCPALDVIRTNQPQSWEWTGPGGRTYQIYDYPFTDVGGTRLVLEMGIDITERKRAEEALRKSEAKLSSIFRAAPVGIGLVVDRVLKTVNERMCEMVGYTADELKGQSARMLYETQEEFERVGRVKYGQIKQYGTGTIETRWQRKDGTVIDIILSSSPIDPDDPTAGVTFTALDITARKRAEEQRLRLEEQLHQASKMEAVGQLAAGVAHDFNNLLTAILGHTELAKGIESLNTDVATSLEMIEQAATQATGVTRSLLTFSRDLPMDRKPVDLRGVVEQGYRFVSRMLPASIEPVLEIESDTEIWVNADGTQLQQVILNLAINARDAMPDGGRLMIRLTTASAEEVSESVELIERADAYARLEVQDAGCGMPPEVQPRVFEPFFSTKPRGRGTGLGLSIVHGIVTDHGGVVSVRSDPGHGSTFTVLLPCLESCEELDRAMADGAVRRGQGQVVLLAEDDPFVRETTIMMLRAIGYDVLPTADGDEALERFRAEHERIDLVLLDIDLPKRDGRTCLQAVREMDGTVPAILTTGSARFHRQDERLERVAYLYKPIHLTELAELMAEMLNETADSDTAG